jgi:hypothetical protein
VSRVAESVAQELSKTTAGKSVSFDLPDAMMTELWEKQRPSCLKRSTIGAYLLDTLEPDWQGYVEFHLNRLECGYCRANLEDMQSSIQEVPAQELRNRIMQSTVGFLSNYVR